MIDTTITSVIARQVYDSRSNPTIEVEVQLVCGAKGIGIVPSGASTGQYEALELRDGGSKLDGKGIRKALNNINSELAPLLVGEKADHQRRLDRLMIEKDGTQEKKRLGANAILGCSMACAHAAAEAYHMPLYQYLGGKNAHVIPVPMVQIIGGGAHAPGTTDIQDYLIIPKSADSFAKGYEMVVEVYMATKKIFKQAGKPLALADEGGLWPSDMKSNEEPIGLIMEAINAAGYVPGKDICIALDIASSEFYRKESKDYYFKLEKKKLSSDDLVELLVSWAEKYPIISIEDGCSEDDWNGNRNLSDKLRDKIQLIGDDLFTTNIERILYGAAKGINNSVLIKMNQIGTLSETLDAIAVTQKLGYNPVISARSGETEDVTIVHLALATNAGQLKVGSCSRSERTAKWNEVIRIEERLADEAQFSFADVFRNVV